MQLDLPTWLIFGIVELWVAVVLLVIVLLFHSKKLRKLVKSLKDQIFKLEEELDETKGAFEQAQEDLVGGEAFKKQLNEQLLYTRQYHKSLTTKAIEKDIDLNEDESRLSAALRHAFLSAEKASQDASKNNDGKPHWNTYIGHMSQLTERLISSHTPEQTSTEATQASDDDTDDEFVIDTPIVNNMESRQVSTAEEELKRLRSVTENQYKEIADLKSKLQNSDFATENEKTDLIHELKENLSKQERMMQESDTCIKLLETELDEALEKSRDLEKRLEAQKNTSSADQLREMAKRIQRLQTENDQLVSMLERSS